MRRRRGRQAEGTARARVPGALALRLGLALTLGAAATGCTAPPAVVPPPAATSVPSVTDDSTERTAAVTALIAQRAAAVGMRDEKTWMATVADPASPFGQAQSGVFERMLRLPIGRYEGRGVEVGAAPDAASRERLGAEAWTASVTVAYELAGFDRGLRAVTTSYVVTRTPAGWRLTDVSDPGPAQPWDLTPLRVLRSASTLVVGNAPDATLRSYLATADAAHARIASVWGSAVPAVVVAATDGAGFVSQLDRSDDTGLDQVAAVTDGPLEPGQTASADRVYVNPTAFAGLTDAGRRQVITHELTHVTVRATTTRAVPLWLSEGFADHLGWATVSLPPRIVAAELLSRVRAGRGPTRLPVDADFDPATGVIGPVYSSAWLAVGRMVSRYGQARVVDFYREVAGARAVDPSAAADPASAASRAFPTALGVSEAAFTADWLAYLRELAR